MPYYVKPNWFTIRRNLNMEKSKKVLLLVLKIFFEQTLGFLFIIITITSLKIRLRQSTLQIYKCFVLLPMLVVKCIISTLNNMHLK